MHSHIYMRPDLEALLGLVVDQQAEVSGGRLQSLVFLLFFLDHRCASIIVLFVSSVLFEATSRRSSEREFARSLGRSVLHHHNGLKSLFKGPMANPQMLVSCMR